MPETPALPASPNALSVVLDSNVWIDILVFDDPHTRPILAALEPTGRPCRPATTYEAARSMAGRSIFALSDLLSEDQEGARMSATGAKPTLAAKREISALGGERA